MVPGGTTMDRLDAALDAYDALDDEERSNLLWALHDDITKHLDKLGWQIVCQPQNIEPGCVVPMWFLDEPSKDCPTWCGNGIKGNVVWLRPTTE
jgi:hypothetical protein